MAAGDMLAEAGDTLTCPNCHAVAAIVQDMPLGDRVMPGLFANWRGREDWTPQLPNPNAGICGDPLPMCPTCGASPWVSPHGDLRPWMEHGYRCLPGDPAQGEEVSE